MLKSVYEDFQHSVKQVRRILSVLGLLLLYFYFQYSCNSNETTMTAIPEAGNDTPSRVMATEHGGLSYLLYLPGTYKTQKKWPLILYLHGASLRGTDVNRVKAYGIPALLERGKPLPFIVVAPQCPPNQNWHKWDETLLSLLDVVSDEYAVDEKRMYLTGMSLGGSGAWHLAAQQPETFAALAPLCGYGNPLLAKQYQNLPIWLFHGAKDRAVPVDISDKMNAEIRKIGGEIKYSRFPESGHNIVEKVYGSQELYDWFLQHQR